MTGCGNSDGHWHVGYITYEKYGAKPHKTWVNSVTEIRKVLPAEMAVPTMRHKRWRFCATFGQFDPFYGFAPAGTPLRTKD